VPPYPPPATARSQRPAHRRNPPGRRHRQRKSRPVSPFQKKKPFKPSRSPKPNRPSIRFNLRLGRRQIPLSRTISPSRPPRFRNAFARTIRRQFSFFRPPSAIPRVPPHPSATPPISSSALPAFKIKLDLFLVNKHAAHPKLPSSTRAKHPSPRDKNPPPTTSRPSSSSRENTEEAPSTWHGWLLSRRTRPKRNRPFRRRSTPARARRSHHPPHAFDYFAQNQHPQAQLVCMSEQNPKPMTTPAISVSGLKSVRPRRLSRRRLPAILYIPTTLRHGTETRPRPPRHSTSIVTPPTILCCRQKHHQRSKRATRRLDSASPLPHPPNLPSWDAPLSSRSPSTAFAPHNRPEGKLPTPFRLGFLHRCLCKSWNF